MTKIVIHTVFAFAAAGRVATAAYESHVLVANDAAYAPEVMVDPNLQDAWGVSIRPPGAGGHFWVSNAASGTTTTYIGDVHHADGTFTPLYQDTLKSVDIAVGTGHYEDGRLRAPTPIATGQVYNPSASDFVISGEGISGPAKFIFASAEGTISAWTELADPQPGDPNHKRRQSTTVMQVDHSDQYENGILRYTGLAITNRAADNRLYASNFATHKIESFDSQFQPTALSPTAFTFPGQRPDETPWNIQYLQRTPTDPGSLFVAYAVTDDAWEEVDYAGAGVIAQFDLDGNLIRKFDQKSDFVPLAEGELAAPWGFAVAPADFGPLSGTLLVSNFGDGTIVGYDLDTGAFVDYLRDAAGRPIKIEGIWGLTFGNGVALGDSNALYFTAGPNGEQDGLFGAIRYTAVPEPAAVTLLSAGTLILRRRRAR